MTIARSCVPKTEKSYSWISTSPESAALYYTRDTHKRQLERLASLASRRQWRFARLKHEHHRSDGAEQSRT